MLMFTMKQAEKHGYEILEYVMCTKDPAVITNRSKPYMAIIPYPGDKAMMGTAIIKWKIEGIPGLDLLMTTSTKVVDKLTKGK